MSAISAQSASSRTEVSLPRLYLLRLLYAVWTVGLIIRTGPRFFPVDLSQPVMDTVVNSVLIGLAVMAALGVRYPLRMVPLLLFEIVWKTVWLFAIGLPLWLGGDLDAKGIEVMKAILTVVVFPFIIPWPHVFRHYIAAPGDAWK